MEKKYSLFTFIYNDLFSIIQSNHYLVGDTIPTELELAKKYNVSRPTIHKVVKRLQEEGYLESKAGYGTIIRAKPQKTNEIKTFGLIFPFLNTRGLFPRLANSIASLSSYYNFNIMWGGQFPEEKLNTLQLNNMTDFYIQQQVDGVFFSPVELSPSCKEINAAIIEKLKKNNIPIVILDSNYKVFPDNTEFDFVSIDNFRAGYYLAKHFIENGVRRIDYCTMPHMGETVKIRLRGLRCALAEYGIFPDQDWVHLLSDNNEEYVNEIISSGADNLICSNDAVAMKTIDLLHEKGYHIPKQIRVAGFDNSEYSRTTQPKLTTISQPTDKLAVLAVQTMIRRLKFPDMPPSELFINFELLIRESTFPE